MRGRSIGLVFRGVVVLAALAAEVQPRYEPAPRSQPLTAGPTFLGVFLGLLALDWALRRKWRVV